MGKNQNAEIAAQAELVKNLSNQAELLTTQKQQETAINRNYYDIFEEQKIEIAKIRKELNGHKQLFNQLLEQFQNLTSQKQREMDVNANLSKELNDQDHLVKKLLEQVEYLTKQNQNFKYHAAKMIQEYK